MVEGQVIALAGQLAKVGSPERGDDKLDTDEVDGMIRDQKATTIAGKLLFGVVTRYRAFRELHSNQGTNFGSQVMAEVCQLFGIHKTRTTPYHPRSDGFIERSFSVVHVDWLEIYKGKAMPVWVVAGQPGCIAV